VLKEQLSKVTAEKESLQKAIEELTASRLQLSANLNELTDKLAASEDLLKAANAKNLVETHSS